MQRERNKKGTTEGAFAADAILLSQILYQVSRGWSSLMVTIVAVVLGVAALYPWMKGWWFVPAVVSLFLVPAALFALSKGVMDVFSILAVALVVAWSPKVVRTVVARQKDVSFAEAPQISLTVRR